MRIRARWYAIGILLLATAASEPRGAYAAGDRTNTLRRAVANVLLGPFDVALSPVVTVQTLRANARAANYSPAATVALGLVGGTAWFLPVSAAPGAFRIWGGFAEIPIGLALLVSKSFTNWEPEPFFEVSDKAALVSYPNAPIPIVFGVNYLASP